MEWNDLRASISELTGLSEKVLDAVSVWSILVLFAEGKSNETISKDTDYDTDFVSKAIAEHFDVVGWNKDLDFSPIVCYNMCNGDIAEFNSIVYSISDEHESDVDKAYHIASIFSELQEEIDKEYDNS